MIGYFVTTLYVYELYPHRYLPYNHLTQLPEGLFTDTTQLQEL